MSLVEKTEPALEVEPAPGSPADPFRLGWRNVPRTLPDGEVEFEQVPLTLEDLLFPEESDHAMNHPAHAEDCYYLYGCLKMLLAEVPRSLVLTDCRVDFNIPGVRPLGPDVAAFLDVAEGWSAATLYLGMMAARPVLVAEVTSPDTRRQDFDRKRDFYHRANVPCYVIVDSQYHQGIRSEVELIGFRHTLDGYEPIPPDDQGRVQVEPLGFWLKVEGERVVCIDGQTGRPIEAFLGQAQARKAAEARAETAEARVETAEARAETAEANARAEAEARTHAEARARAVDETWERLAELARAEARGHAEANARAAASNAARLDAEARMAAVEAELRRLRG